MASLDFSELRDKILSKEAWGTAWEQNQHLWPMYLHLIVSAVLPIYAGAHASLSRPSSAAKPTKDDANTDEDDEEEETVQKMEGLTPKDAVIFPVTAGITLTMLYFAIKYWGAGVINSVLGIYFSLVGTYSVGKLVSDSGITLAGFLLPDYYQSKGKLWKVLDNERKSVVVGGRDGVVTSRLSPFGGFLGAMPLPSLFRDFGWGLRQFFTKKKFVAKGFWEDVITFRVIFTRNNVAAAVCGVTAIGYSLFFDKPWWLTNLQGFAVCYGALQLMSPTTFATGSMILTGLFFYDIWAVFFTPLMITVAKNLDVPIKMVFPRPDDPNFPQDEGAKRSYSMLGLGDIVLPGLMIGLALRFDLYMFYLRKQKPVTSSKQRSKQKAEKTTTVEKAPYVSVVGNWGEWFHTATLFGNRSSSSVLPAHLSNSFPKHYFHASLIGYVFGMAATLVAMSFSQHGQPALLYLVPGVLSSIWGTALCRREYKQMWDFTEAVNAEPLEDDGGKEEKSKQEGPEEAGSFFSELWKWIFGEGQDDKDGKDGKDSKKQKSAETKDEIPRPADIGKDVVFSFSITHHFPRSKGESKKATVNGAKHKKTSAHPKKASPSSSASTDDEAVLVGSDDLEEK
jgi:minor histocompatibility antigen H13